MSINLEAIREAVREDGAQPETWRDRKGARLKGWRRSEVHRRVLLDWVDRMRETLAELTDRADAVTRKHPGRGHPAHCLCQLCDAFRAAEELLREMREGSE